MYNATGYVFGFSTSLTLPVISLSFYLFLIKLIDTVATILFGFHSFLSVIYLFCRTNISILLLLSFLTHVPHFHFSLKLLFLVQRYSKIMTASLFTHFWSVFLHVISLLNPETPSSRPEAPESYFP